MYKFHKLCKQSVSEEPTKQIKEDINKPILPNMICRLNVFPITILAGDFVDAEK